MNMPLVILMLGVLYFLAHGLSLLFRTTRVPDVLVLIFVGVAGGPMLGILSPRFFGSFGAVLTTTALAVILFESGLSLNLRSMTKSLAPTAGLTLVSYFVTMAVATAGALAMGFSPEEALVTGAIVGGTSSAVVIPMVRALRINGSTATVLVLESAITDVLCIVITFGLLDAASSGTLAIGGVLRKIGASFLFATALGMAGGVLWLKLLRRVREGEATLFTTVASAFLLFGAAELLGLSGGIAVLAFGIALANAPVIAPEADLPELNSTERMFFGELVFLLKTFFFLYLGLSMRFQDLQVLLWAAGIVAVIYTARLWVTRLTLSGASRRDARLAAFLVPKGLAAAVLAGIPAQRGLPGGGQLQMLVYSIVLVSIVLTSVLVAAEGSLWMRRLTDVFFRKYPEETLPSD
ncbi:MAG: cation:proton antiporter [Bdellovibrionales bacterium]|nr:cation:proton antiporter [Bdellovibrionales bacterium]